ncbi:cornifelin homolog [Sardina pilchardus]|uniref:cornifelin homolog n=1 Tax=Sardina pilchardus TaxID=27697 RepID=UPI002E11E10E
MASNVVVMQQPQHQVQPVVMVRSDVWSTDIFDCFDDMSVCCCACFCLPCFACMTTGNFDEFCGLPCFDITCWASMVTLGIGYLYCCVPPGALSIRYGVRKQYGIQGALCSDCVLVTFCNACSWCQVAREIKRRKKTFVMINPQPTVIQSPVVQNTVVQSSPVIQNTVVQSSPVIQNTVVQSSPVIQNSVVQSSPVIQNSVA